MEKLLRPHFGEVRGIAVWSRVTPQLLRDFFMWKWAQDDVERGVLLKVRVPKGDFLSNPNSPFDLSLTHDLRVMATGGHVKERHKQKRLELCLKQIPVSRIKVVREINLTITRVKRKKRGCITIL